MSVFTAFTAPEYVYEVNYNGFVVFFDTEREAIEAAAQLRGHMQDRGVFNPDISITWRLR